jgi:hypothetical protein
MAVFEPKASSFASLKMTKPYFIGVSFSGKGFSNSLFSKKSYKNSFL